VKQSNNNGLQKTLNQMVTSMASQSESAAATNPHPYYAGRMDG